MESILPFQIFDRSLMVGTTGMLLAANLWVAERSRRCFVVSRQASCVAPLVGLESVQSLDLDWTNQRMFRNGLTSVGALEQIGLAVLWLHRSGDAQARWIIQRLSKTPCLIVRVLGSQAGIVEVIANRQGGYKIGAACIISVILGAKRETGRKRWLTWEEISQGVIAAITQRESRIIGNLTNRTS